MNIIERAYQIAPECGSVEEVKKRLVREGYFNVNAHLTGRQIRTDLQQRLNANLVEQGRKRRGSTAAD